MQLRDVMRTRIDFTLWFFVSYLLGKLRLTLHEASSIGLVERSAYGCDVRKAESTNERADDTKKHVITREQRRMKAREQSLEWRSPERDLSI